MLFTQPAVEEIFNGGPPIRLERALRLRRLRLDLRIEDRSLAVVLVSWLPLAVLLMFTELVTGKSDWYSFLTDTGCYARYVIAAPLLILAEGDTIPIFGKVIRHFLLGGFIPAQENNRYDAAVCSTRRLLNSKIVEFASILIAYLIAIVAVIKIPREDTPSWYWFDSNLPFGLSPAGMWQVFFSLPLLLLLCLGWLWRIALWWRFLWLMSRLDLILVSTHPDQAGGMKFVSTSVRGFRILALAFSTVVAGAHTNQMLHSGLNPKDLRTSAIAVAVFVLLFATGPLFLFFSKLRETRLKGVFKYGALVRDVGVQFEKKWLDRLGTFDSATLSTNDFSAMTDLNQVVGNAHSVRDIPFSWRDVSYLAVIAVIPFLPAALMSIPLSDLLHELLKLVV